MATSRSTRSAYVLFSIGLVYFIIASVSGWTVHWSSWLLLAAVSLLIASNFVGARRARASEFLTIGSAALMLVSLVGMVASKFQ